LSYTVDTSSITISTDTAHSGMSIWVGLRIDNEGSLPLNFSGASYSWSLLPGGITVSIHEYFYGPWKTNWPHEVWADVNIHDLEEHGAPAGNVPPPITLEPPGGKKKMILWVHIELGCPPDTFPFEITIRLPCPTTGGQVTTSSYTWGRP
jgi:hypothetical protein